MNKKIEQLLDLALSSPQVADNPKIKERLINDARQLDYLTINEKKTVKLVEGLREGVGNEVNIDVIFALYLMMTVFLSNRFMPNVDIEQWLAEGLVNMVKHDKN